MKKLTCILAAALCLASCDYLKSLVHEGDLVARAGSHKLYSGEVEAYVPKGLPYEDSLSLARQYIETWAIAQLYDDLARKELSKADQDVSKELDDYRRALLKYRYEQSYINQRLDTLISDDQIGAWYDAHQEQLRLTQPIVKARFVVMHRNSPKYATVKKEISVDDEDGMVATDSLLIMSTIRNTSFGGRWIEASVLASELGMGVPEMFRAERGGYVEKVDDEGNASLAYIFEKVEEGKVGPQEYYRDRIKDIILSARKQQLLDSLEQELLDDARRQDNYVIY